MPADNSRSIGKRLFYTLSKLPSAHRSVGLIKHPQQRAFLFTASHGRSKLKISSCCKSQLHKLTAAVDIQLYKAFCSASLCLIQIAQQSAQCSEGVILAAKSYLISSTAELCGYLGHIVYRELLVVKLFCRAFSVAVSDKCIRLLLV